MLRNREFRNFGIVFLAVTTVSVVVGFFISPPTGILAFVSAAVFGTLFIVFTKARYRSIAQISKQIDLILHNADRLDLGNVDEGELSILHSEITKMTLRIREQNAALKKDKQYLANSLADIAHQLGTPLTSANLLLSFLTKETDEKKRLTYVHELEGLLVQMDWLIASLLKISRVDAGVVAFQKEEILVCDIMDLALRPLAISMELRGINLVVGIPQDATIQGDLGWQSEALQNILKNCMENIGENREIAVSCTVNNFYTEIVVRDSGAGFDANDLPYLFDRFYRGKNAGTTGYGIGLALSKMIITRQGGSITARNHPDGGALFAIRFPK
jgi:signal transduction histidine kinase